MRCIILTLIFLVTLLVTGISQNKNHLVLSSKITTETKNIGDFNNLKVEDDFEVIIQFSDKASEVKIEANENLHPYIIVERVGNTLEISTKSYSTGNYGNSKKNWKKGARERLVAYITTKELASIKGRNDVVIELENRLVANKLDIELAGDSKIAGTLEVQNLVVDLSGDSYMDVKGQAKTLKLDARGDSMIKGYDFTIHDLDVSLRGDSEAKLTVNGDINLLAKGDSNFYYRGNGKMIKKQLYGDSEVKYW